ncbi:hypothetical protein PFISCL1PPCAC_20040, partial [Pristionchus fissidentatus]
ASLAVVSIEMNSTFSSIQTTSSENEDAATSLLTSFDSVVNTTMTVSTSKIRDPSFSISEYIIMGILLIFGGSMIAIGLIFIFLRDKSPRLKFDKKVNARLKKLGVEPAKRKIIRDNVKELTRSHTESPNLSNTSLISNI